MALSNAQVQQVLESAERLFDAKQVEAAYDRLAAEITLALRDCSPIVLSVLTGGLIPTGHLVTRLAFPLQLDYLHATRYRGEVRGKELVWIARPSIPMTGRSVLIVDDILDEGMTLDAILNYCRGQGAKDVYSAVLVEKQHDRRLDHIHADFKGLEVNDRYVFGCGMDYKGYLRNLREIYAVTD